MSSIQERIMGYFEELGTNVERERVIEYLVREIHKGRRLTEIIDDPYVRNRMNDAKRAEILENTEIVEALEQEIRETFKAPEVGFDS